MPLPTPAPPAPCPAAAPRRSRRQLLRLALSGSAGLASWAGAAAWAASLARPAGRVVLSVVGQVRQSNVAGRADFDMAMLEALPQHSFSADTPWFSGPRRFSGPLLRDVLAAAGAQGSQLRAVALNRYKVDIPAEDAQQFNMLLATRINGAPMAVRDKGPLFIVYPFDQSAALRTELYYGRSAWQLRTIEVK